MLKFGQKSKRVSQIIYRPVGRISQQEMMARTEIPRGRVGAGLRLGKVGPQNDFQAGFFQVRGTFTVEVGSIKGDWRRGLKDSAMLQCALPEPPAE